MKKAMFLVLIVLLALPLGVTQAQGPTSGSGGPIIEGNFGGSVTWPSFNPIRTNDSATSRIKGMMYPTLVGASPYTADFAKAGEEGVFGALATDWSISEDGLTYNFTLRDDAKWTDGEPVTATDVKFSFDAIASGQIDAPLYGLINYVPTDNEIGVKEIKIIDDYHLEITVGQASCTALSNMGFSVAPAHVFGYDGSPDFDFSVLVDNDFDFNPTVSYGPFQFASFSAGEAIGLKTVDNWAEGTVIPSGFVYRDVPDQNVLVEQFLSGETNFIDQPPPSRAADVRNAPGVQSKVLTGDSWDYIGLNLADPENPQPGFDADGNPIDQGHHPIFGDVRVRRAFQMGINVADIVQGAYFGEGSQMASYLKPSSWAHDPALNAVAYDPEAAGALLDEAGWVMGSDGVRVCKGCEYAKEGAPLEFELITNSGNTRREAIGTIVQDQLGQLGFKVDFQAIDFQTLIDTTFGAQTYDAFILGWGGGFPDDPNSALQFFSPAGDDPDNQANNAMSYNNPDLMKLITEAASVPGCDQATRAALYHQIEKMVQDDQPYIWLATRSATSAAQGNVQGFDPLQAQIPVWNVHTWNVVQQ
jgi:peptide/nickel transport system substrate-binding protein